VLCEQQSGQTPLLFDPTGVGRGRQVGAGVMRWPVKAFDGLSGQCGFADLTRPGKDLQEAARL
jgi:hypothetical protein